MLYSQQVKDGDEMGGIAETGRNMLRPYGEESGLYGVKRCGKIHGEGS